MEQYESSGDYTVTKYLYEISQEIRHSNTSVILGKRQVVYNMVIAEDQRSSRQVVKPGIYNIVIIVVKPKIRIKTRQKQTRHDQQYKHNLQLHGISTSKE